MPNHLHSLVFTKNESEEINFHIGETKRFMSYEIVSRLKKLKRTDLLKIMQDTVNPNESKKKKIHNVFQPSSDIKEIITEKFIRQKLNYMHKNPVSGKWKLVDDYIDYIHSSARFSAIVGVPKSLLKRFERFYRLCANFLVTNNKGSGRGSSLIKH